jgi:hypothetical protein
VANSVLKMPEGNERVFQVFFLLSRCCSSSMAQRFKAVAIFFQISNIAHDALTNYCSSSCRSFVASMKNPFFSGARYRPWNRPSSASASMSSELALLAHASIPDIIRTIVLFHLRLDRLQDFSLFLFSLLSNLFCLPLPSSPLPARSRLLPASGSAHYVDRPHTSTPIHTDNHIATAIVTPFSRPLALKTFRLKSKRQTMQLRLQQVMCYYYNNFTVFFFFLAYANPRTIQKQFPWKKHKKKTTTTRRTK